MKDKRENELLEEALQYWCKTEEERDEERERLKERYREIIAARPELHELPPDEYVREVMNGLKK